MKSLLFKLCFLDVKSYVKNSIPHIVGFQEISSVWYLVIMFQSINQLSYFNGGFLMCRISCWSSFIVEWRLANSWLRPWVEVCSILRAWSLHSNTLAQFEQSFRLSSKTGKHNLYCQLVPRRWVNVSHPKKHWFPDLKT